MQGILTTDLSAAVEGVSTVGETYRQPEGPQVRCVGRRQEALLHQLQAMVSREVEEEFTPTPPPVDYRSTTKKDFFQGDKPCCVLVHGPVESVLLPLSSCEAVKSATFTSQASLQTLTTQSNLI